MLEVLTAHIQFLDSTLSALFMPALPLLYTLYRTTTTTTATAWAPGGGTPSGPTGMYVREGVPNRGEQGGGDPRPRPAQRENFGSIGC